jgi:alkaline phosphatase
VALNSEIALGEGSAQLRWLERDLAASRARCTLAYWHRPRFSSGRYGDDPGLRPAWRVLYRAGADVVLTGHDHGYQRFRALDPEGRPDPRRGIRQWVVGTGGRSHHPLRPDARRLAGDDSAFGVLRLALRRGRFDFAFLPAAGGEYRDAGRGVRCH